MRRVIFILLMKVLVSHCVGQHFSIGEWEGEIPSDRVSLSDSLALVATYAQDSTTLVLVNINDPSVRESVSYDGYILVPQIQNDVVIGLRQFQDSSSHTILEFIKLDMMLNEVSSNSIPIEGMENYVVTSPVLTTESNFIFSGNMNKNGVYNHTLLTLNFDGELLNFQEFDDYGRFDSFGFLRNQDNFITWGYPLDSQSFGADLLVFQLNDSLEILDSTRLYSIAQESGTPYGSRIESIGKAHEEMQVISNELLLISGTSRNFYQPTFYQETNSYITYLDLSTNELLHLNSQYNIDSNSFSVFSPALTCDDESHYIMLTTEGSSNSLDIVETVDSYLKIMFFDENLELVSKYSHYKGDSIYQRFHSAATNGNRIVILGSEYSEFSGLRSFISVLDCKGELLGHYDDLVPEVKFNIYPNPTPGMVNIRSNDEILRVAVFNAQGVLVQSGTSSRVDLRQLPNGVYFFTIFSVTGKVSKRKVLKYN